MYDQDIIEKRPASPLATALLGTACACLIGAMVLQGMMLSRYNEGNGEKGVLTSADNWEKGAKKVDAKLRKTIKGE